MVRGTRAEPAVTPLSFGLRWWPVLLIGVLLGIAAAFLYLEQAPVSYQSTALLVVSSQQADQRGESWITSNPARLRDATELLVEQATLPPVYEAVSRVLQDRLDVTSSDLAAMALAGVLDVHQNGRSNYITVSATSTSADRAWLLADGYARGLIDNVNEQVRIANDRHRVEIARQSELTQQQIRALPLKSPDAGVNQTVASVYATLLQNLIQDQVQVDMASSGSGPLSRSGSVTDPIPVTNLRKVYLAGAAAGGALGLALAVALELVRLRWSRRTVTVTARPVARPVGSLRGRRRSPAMAAATRNGHRPPSEATTIRGRRRTARVTGSPIMKGM